MVGVMSYGVYYDIVHVEDAHTVSRVPISALANGTATTSIFSVSVISATANWNTGDEIRVPPHEVRARQTQEPRSLSALVRHRMLTYALQIEREIGTKTRS
jgi:hypothetical protein